MNHAFIADLHLAHANVIKFDGRPFAGPDEHDRVITENCASAGRPGWTLWVLGDVAKTKDALTRFLATVKPRWGAVNLIRGNHDDRSAWQLRDQFTEAHEARYVRVNKEVKVYLSHYACRTWRNSHHGSYHLHGHSHGALPRWGRSMDVGVNCIGYRPITMEQVIEELKGARSVNHHTADGSNTDRTI